MNPFLQISLSIELRKHYIVIRFGVFALWCKRKGHHNVHLPKTCLVRNIKTRISIILNGSKVRGRGLYKLEIESLKNLEVNGIYGDLNKFEDPIIKKSILWHQQLGDLNLKLSINYLTNKQKAFRALKLPNIYSICEVYLRGKQVKKKFPKANMWITKHILYFIHKNDPSNIKSLGSLLFHHIHWWFELKDLNKSV
jgi:hypothetical protein